MPYSKKNVEEFNDDVKSNEGYLYTTHPPLSSVLANGRISEAVEKHIFSCKTLVDIGCGDGVYTGEIKKRVPRLLVEGFDPARDAILSAQKKYPDIAFKVINILDENIRAKSRAFEVGILRGVLHHLSDQELAIKNALAISDMLIIVEPNGNNPILKIIEKISPYHRKHEEQSFTSSRLEKWCIQAGARIVFKEFIGFVPFFCPAPLAKIIHFFQPALEKIPVVREFFSAQIVLVCRKNT